MIIGRHKRLAGLSTLIGAALVAYPVEAQVPDLPEGLPPAKSHETSQDEPPASEPALPSGLGEEAAAKPDEQDRVAQSSFFGDILTGFVEGRAGVRTQNDRLQKDMSIGEARLRLQTEFTPQNLAIRFVGDFIYDDVDEDRAVDLETGQGWFDLREANITVRPFSFADVKVGRQILTWGTGDLIFINDLFPKDFQSFFIGRDVEYLKAPSDAVRVSTFFDLFNVDMVYTPRFDADRSIDGTRLTFFNPAQGVLTGQNAVLVSDAPDAWFQDEEIAARLYRNVGAFEVAAYFYDGFWKSPGGISRTGRAIHPDLRVYGASTRGPLMGGIVNAEVGHYDSRDDSSGDNPFIQNSETRFLVGFERDAGSDLTIGIQYFAQLLWDVEALRANLFPGQRSPDRIRHTLTVRLTKLAFNQNLTLNAFNFWSPNDDDGHLRLRAGYKVTDDWLVETGANVFYGPDRQTFFGQLESNSNVFVGVRRSF